MDPSNKGPPGPLENTPFGPPKRPKLKERTPQEPSKPVETTRRHSKPLETTRNHLNLGYPLIHGFDGLHVTVVFTGRRHEAKPWNYIII